MMKSKTKLLIATATVPLWLMVTACRAEAEETNVVDQPPAAEISPAETAPPDASLADTNAPAGEAEPEVLIDQEITVLRELPPALPPDLNLSKAVEAVVRLAQSGVSEAVILAYVEKSDDAYNLDAPGILYLNDIGISPMVLAAMLNKDGASEELRELVGDEPELAAAPEPVLETDPAAAGEAPPPINRSLLTGGYGAAQHPVQTPVEVTTNYVASAPEVIVQQQPVIVEQPVVVQQPVIYSEPAVVHSYFYSSLRPYGSWIYVSDYGWCWQPTIAVSYRGWRPYTHGGRWLYSDAGWYWQSDYSWGWAPFHYGRWFSSPSRGWVWVPDYTWGPSWVTWRSSTYYAGWAPLPPRAHYRPGFGFSYFDRHVGVGFSFGLRHDHYSFVPKRYFCDRRLVHRVMPTAHTVNIYQNSTVVNNYIVGDNNTIINRGISRDLVARHSRSEIPQVAVREIPPGQSRAIQPDRVRRQGDDLVVYRPRRPSPALAEAAETATRREAARIPSRSAESAVPATGRAGLVSGARPVSPSASPITAAGQGATRAESRRAAPAASAASPDATDSAPVTRGRIPTAQANTTWARPEPFVRPAAEPGLSQSSAASATATRSTAAGRSEISRTRPVASGAGTSGVAARPVPGTAQAITPAQPGGRSTSPLWQNQSSQSPWTGRATPATPAPATTAPAARVPSVGRAEVARPTAPPTLGRSPVPGANLGTTQGQMSSQSVAPARPAPSVAPAPATRYAVPGTTFSNPNPVRPAAPPPSVAGSTSRPLTRTEAYSRPVTPGISRAEAYSRPPQVAPAPSVQSQFRSPVPAQRALPVPSVQPSYQSPAVRSAPATRAEAYSAPVQPRPAPSVAAPPAIQRQQAAPATGRGRMEINR